MARAIGRGELALPDACESCGRKERERERETQWVHRTIHYHHWDYSKPLDVIPLCRSCHWRVHNGKIPEPRTGRIYVQPKRKPKTYMRLAQFLRERRGNTPQYKIAQAAGIHPTALSMYEGGKRLPRSKAFFRLMDALGISGDDLLAAMSLAVADD